MKTDIVDSIMHDLPVVGYCPFHLDNGTAATRFVIAYPLTEKEKAALRHRSRRIIGFGTATYKYAPEIKYDTIIVRERRTR